MDLVQRGVITNEKKKTLHPGKIVAGFMIGTPASCMISSTTTRSSSSASDGVHQRSLRHRSERPHGIDQLGH